MSEILQSLKSDLLDRRLLPILLVLGLALAGAVAYIVLAGGGSSASPVAAVAATPTPLTQGPSLPVTQAPANPNAAVAETTDGARFQHKSGSHDPFTPLASPPAPQTQTAKTQTTASTGTSGGSSSSVSSASTSSPSTTAESTSGASPVGGSPAPTQTSKPVAPKKKPKPVYKVTVQFGLVPATPGVLSQLTPYADLKRLQPLPSVDDPRIVFAGARGNGKGAVFTLNREAILKGQAICVPSTSQCEAIELAVGQTEELAYLEPGGLSVPYELKLVSISKLEAATASAARRHHRHHHR